MAKKKESFLYLVTHRQQLSDNDFFDLILRAVDGGVDIVQLREKNTDLDQFKRLGERLLILLEPFDIPLIINDSLEVAKSIGAHGIHLGQTDSSVTEARTVLGKDAIIGLSVETLAQGIKANTLDLNYIAVSPVFATATKPDAVALWSLNDIAHLCKLSKHPVFGIGGINCNNLSTVLRCGLAGVAVVSAIFDVQDPRIAAKELKEIMLNED